MSSNKWKTATLGSVAEIIMGQSPAGETCNEIGNGVPLLNGPTEFGNFHPKPVQYTTDPKKFSKAGDILFCVRGSTTGRMNWADKEYAIGRGLAAIRHKNGKEFQPFLKGIIDFYLPYLLTEATGSTFPNVSSQQLSSLVIEVPSLPTQRRIADILSALDEKIELNRQTNATLEAIAQSIFREWFVDFNFPNVTGEMVENDQGMIPQGWQVGKLGGIVDINMGQSPSGESYNQNGDGIIFFQGKAEFGFRFPTIDKYTTEPKKFAKPFDTLLSVRAPVGSINMASEKCCIGRGLAAISGKNNVWSFTFYLLKSLEEHFNSYEGTGTVFGSINKKELENITVVIPPQEAISEFERIVNPIDIAIFNNEQQTATLASLRDTLLRKLMSGEIEV